MRGNIEGLSSSGFFYSATQYSIYKEAHKKMIKQHHVFYYIDDGMNPICCGKSAPNQKAPTNGWLLLFSHHKLHQEELVGKPCTSMPQNSHLLSGWPKKSPNFIFITKMVFPQGLKFINSGSESRVVAFSSCQDCSLYCWGLCLFAVKR